MNNQHPTPPYKTILNQSPEVEYYSSDVSADIGPFIQYVRKALREVPSPAQNLTEASCTVVVKMSTGNSISGVMRLNWNKKKTKNRKEDVEFVQLGESSGEALMIGNLAEHLGSSQTVFNW